MKITIQSPIKLKRDALYYGIGIDLVHISKSKKAKIAKIAKIAYVRDAIANRLTKVAKRIKT